MSSLYAIHDSYYPGCNDGDVDDRAAIQLYDRYLLEHPEIAYVVVYIVGETRFERAKPYFDEQKSGNIIYENEFDVKEANKADKIIICAPIPDAKVRSELAEIIGRKLNGYCQGNKIGVTNFPKEEYRELLEAIPEKNRFSTETTAITFPTKLLDMIDPKNKGEYLSYGILKLFAIGGIAHIPSLVYRLYCPGIGGGPGTNMLKIQELIYKNIMGQSEMVTTKDNFEEFNQNFIELVKDTECYRETNWAPLNEFMERFVIAIPTANHKAMENSLRVMFYFARVAYAPTDKSFLFNETTTKFYSLSDIPVGKLMFELDETPPLYDFVVSYLILNDYTTLAYFLGHIDLTRDKIMASFGPQTDYRVSLMNKRILIE